jgi:hypothetical protein
MAVPRQAVPDEHEARGVPPDLWVALRGGGGLWVPRVIERKEPIKRWPALFTTIGRHRVRFIVLSIAVLVLVGTSYAFVSYALRSHPGAKSLHSAVRQFRSDGRAPITTELRYAPPSQGVYELKGVGSERISFPPNSETDASIMPATVTYLTGDCWRWHLDYNVAHWEEYTFCPTPQELLQRGNRNFQSWDFGVLTVTNLATFNCPKATAVLPSTPAPGQLLTWTCTGTNSAMSGKTIAKVSTRVVGMPAVVIGHKTVDTIHEVQTTTLSGGQVGTVVENWWFLASSGLPVRVGREIKIVTASPLGKITYTESGTWTMTSLRPVA